MNSFFKRHLITIVSIIIFGSASSALTLHGIYTAACQRSIGVFLDVDDTEITFLTVQGQIQKIRPFEVIYLVQYPIDQLPVSGPINLSEVPRRDLTTLVGTDERPLLKGWPIAFSEDKISFLSESGQEVVVNKESIFAIHRTEQSTAVHIQNSSRPENYKFMHPYVFRDCAEKEAKVRNAQEVYPQQMLSQPVAIKREIDQFRLGYERINRYELQQKFYPVPEIYSNRTSLGVWYTTGSRYGASGKRINNLTPFLVDTYSSDIFDYQHTIRTGSAPLFELSHEEAQTQFYYAFKSSYFHFSGFFDPSLLLVGTNYRWHNSDIAKPDFRLNDTFFVNMGFDFGNWALSVFTDTYQFGAAGPGTTFFGGTAANPRFGLSYRRPKFSVDGFAGGASTGSISGDTDSNGKANLDFSIFRLNGSLYFVKDWKISASLINRSASINVTDTGSTNNSFETKSKSFTTAGYVEYLYRTRVTFGGMLSFEQVSTDFGAPNATNSSSDLYIKSGAYASLSF